MNKVLRNLKRNLVSSERQYSDAIKVLKRDIEPFLFLFNGNIYTDEQEFHESNGDYELHISYYPHSGIISILAKSHVETKNGYYVKIPVTKELIIDAFTRRMNFLIRDREERINNIIKNIDLFAEIKERIL